jgi:hypothetical protein
LGCEASPSQQVLGFLQNRFSTGVSLAELSSVAVVVAKFAEIEPPARDSKRRFQLLVEWFAVNWAVVGPWLLLVDLRDSGCQPITRVREIMERGVI